MAESEIVTTLAINQIREANNMCN